MRGRLGNGDQVFHFREPCMELLHPAELLEKDGRAFGLHECFVQLACNTLHRERGEVHRLTEGDGLVSDAEAESCCELGGTKDPKRILHECLCIDVADDAFREVFPPAEEIQDLTGQDILHQRVHCEIAAECGLLRPEERICHDFEILMSAAGGIFHAGHCDVDFIVFETEDPEACTHNSDFAETGEDLLQLLSRYAVNFYVYIFVLYAEQVIADEPAHIESAAAALCDLSGNFDRHLFVFILHSYCYLDVSVSLPA